MPKAVIPPLPLSGLFGVTKPSGPTSMSVVEKIQGLLGTSRMFVAQDKLNNLKGKKPVRGRRMRELLKVGQGGTLDPLADGVLGENIYMPTKVTKSSFRTNECSNWCG
jgi:tRNA pseudouridine55 synthase